MCCKLGVASWVYDYIAEGLDGDGVVINVNDVLVRDFLNLA